MEYVTDAGTIITDEQLEQEAEALERGEWPDTWDDEPMKYVRPGRNPGDQDAGNAGISKL